MPSSPNDLTMRITRLPHSCVICDTHLLAGRSSLHCQGRLARRVPSQFRSIRRLHTTPRNSAEPSHYEVLNVAPTASSADIKQAFYSLSRKHHPDLHPDDQTASSRFSRISVAYHALSDPKSRSLYDRQHGYDRVPASSRSASGASPNPYGPQRASYAGPAGGRPASGLSRRRTRFQGPPPSFYKAGGYGEQDAKRTQNAAAGSASSFSEGDGSSATKAGYGRAAQSATRGAGDGGGGRGGFDVPPATGLNNDVPHFDRDGHLRVQQQLADRLKRQRERLESAERARRRQAAARGRSGAAATGTQQEQEQKQADLESAEEQRHGQDFRGGEFLAVVFVVMMTGVVPVMAFGW